MFVYLAILITIVLLSERAFAFQIAILEDIDQRYKNIVFKINQQQNLWRAKHFHGEFNQTQDQKLKPVSSVQNITQSDLNDTQADMNQKEQLKNESYNKLPSHFQLKKKYQTFIYPYEVYLIEDQSHQLLEQSFIGFLKKIQNHYNQFHLGMNNTQNTSTTSNINLNNGQNSIKSQSKQQNLTQNVNIKREKPNNLDANHLNPPPFLMFMKVQKCSNENSCKLLKILPKNIVFTPSKLNQYLKIHKISQSDFVIESIIRNNNFETIINGLEASNITDLNETISNNSIKSEQKTSEKDKSKGYSSNVWLYNLNINNHIFYKMHGKESLTIRGYERLMVGHKVIQIQNENQSWDIAFNGSAFRLINHKKQLFTQYLQNNRSNAIQIRNGAEERLIQPKFNNFIPIIRDKIHIPSKLKIPILNPTPQTKTQLKKQLVQYVNTFQIVQYGINQNYQNKPYQIVFFNQEYQSPQMSLFEGYPSLEENNQLRKYQIVNSMQISFRRNLIGSDKNGNFHLYYHQYKNQTQKLTKIFKSTLKQLSLMEQIEHSCLPYKMLRDHQDYKIEWGNQNIVQIGQEKMRSNDREYLAYLQQKYSFTFDKKKSDTNEMRLWKNESKFSRIRNQNQYSFIIKEIKSMSGYSSNSFYNILAAKSEEKEFCMVSIGNKSIVMMKENIFISKLNDQYLVICSQQGYQNETDEHDIMCKIVNTQCQSIYTFTIYLSEYVEIAGKGKYQLRWSLKQCELYQYQTQISLSIFSNFSNESQKYESQQTYIKLYIDKHKLAQYLSQGISAQSNSTRTQQNNTIIYLMEDENTIHGQIQKEKRLNETNQTYFSFVNSYYPNLTFGTLQFNHTDFSANILTIDKDQLLNYQQNNTNKSDNHLYSQFLTTQWELNLLDQATINEEQLQLFENSTYFKYEDYKNRSRYRYLYGSKLMESKLNPIFHLFLGDDVESTEIQQSNCKLEWDQRKLIDVEPYQNQISSEGYRVRRLLRIKFKNSSQQSTSAKEWQICRLSIDTGHQNLVISPEIPESEIKKPYKIFRCAVQNSSLTSKCSYNEQKMENNLILNSNSKSILFIVNNGQVYNLSIQDLNSMEMDKITESFVVMFICLLIVFLTFLSMFMCRRLCMLGRLYLGWMQSEDEPRFRYPLDCIELRLKLKRMKKIGIIREINQKKNLFQEMDENQLHIETDDCVFCLQQKQPQQKIMETYCKHSYHKECFSEWVRQQSNLLSCPMCKRKLNFQGLNRYLDEGGRSEVHNL